MRTIGILTIGTYLAVVSCSNLTDSKNHPPKIVSITATPSIIEVLYHSQGNFWLSAFTQVAIVATDEDGDPLSYTWSSEYGSILDPREATTSWHTDGAGPGNYPVTCIVSDGKDTAKGSISIIVKQK